MLLTLMAPLNLMNNKKCVGGGGGGGGYSGDNAVNDDWILMDLYTQGKSVLL
jgi:hypothetical protein